MPKPLKCPHCLLDIEPGERTVTYQEDEHHPLCAMDLRLEAAFAELAELRRLAKRADTNASLLMAGAA